MLWEIVSPDQDLLAAWETAAFGKDQWSDYPPPSLTLSACFEELFGLTFGVHIWRVRLRNAGIVPDWAAKGLRPAIPVLILTFFFIFNFP